MAQHKTARKSVGKQRKSARSTKKSGPSRPTKSASRRRASSGAAVLAGEEEVAIDRRRSDRRDTEESSSDKSVETGPQLERRKKVNRRRQIDPTTCERDYTDEEVEFMNALDDYKRKSGRMFPTCSEVLEVLRSLGYRRLSAAEFEAHRDTASGSAKPMPSDWSSAVATQEGADQNDLNIGCERQLAY